MLNPSVLGDPVKPSLKQFQSAIVRSPPHGFWKLLRPGSSGFPLTVICQFVWPFVIMSVQRYPTPSLVYIHNHKQTTHINTHICSQPTVLSLATSLYSLGKMGGLILNSIQLSTISTAPPALSLFLT